MQPPAIQAHYKSNGVYVSLEVLFLLWLLNAALAQSQPACPKPQPYALLRQDEDYSYLRDRTCRQDFWDAIKFVSLSAEGSAHLTFGGEVREWYEGFRNANYGIGPQDDNGFLLQRLSVHTNWHFSDRFRFFAQVSSGLEFGRAGGPQPTDEDKLWVEEALFDIKAMNSKNRSLTLRVGRQQFEFGAGRLVDVREGPNVRLAFDGADLILRTPTWHVDAFATRPVVNRIGIFDDPPDHTVMFWGVYGVRPLPTHGGNIDIYYLGINRRQATFDRGTAQEVRHTVGTRLWATPEVLDYDAEGMLQLGAFGDASIRAWGSAADIGHTFRSVDLKPRVDLHLTATSGDRGRRAGPLGTLNPLFPTGIYFGESAVNLNGPSNLMRIGQGIQLALRSDLRLVVDYDAFWRTSLEDGVYGLGVNLLRSGSANRDRYIGSQPSFGIHWQIDRHFTVSTAYTHFSVGPFFSNGTGLGRSVDNAGIWGTYKF